jgi:glycosyltransferase involved in cell wall biosynthesis
MVGDGPDHASALGLSAQLGVSDRVHFLGSQEAVEKILPCADVFVLPSEYESFGLAALEAMACGVAVVASDAGGIPEVVVPGASGELYPMGDVESLARCLKSLLLDEDRLRALRGSARRHAESEFALQKILPRYEAYYRRVLGQECKDLAAGES